MLRRFFDDYQFRCFAALALIVAAHALQWLLLGAAPELEMLFGFCMGVVLADPWHAAAAAFKDGRLYSTFRLTRALAPIVRKAGANVPADLQLVVARVRENLNAAAASEPRPYSMEERQAAKGNPFGWEGSRRAWREAIDEARRDVKGAGE